MRTVQNSVQMECLPCSPSLPRFEKTYIYIYGQPIIPAILIRIKPQVTAFHRDASDRAEVFYWYICIHADFRGYRASEHADTLRAPRIYGLSLGDSSSHPDEHQSFLLF